MGTVIRIIILILSSSSDFQLQMMRAQMQATVIQITRWAKVRSHKTS